MTTFAILGWLGALSGWTLATHFALILLRLQHRESPEAMSDEAGA